MAQTLNTDVLVVGGGPAGLSAAIAARMQGLRVLVADCLFPPIDKACGEGLMPDSLEALAALGISLDGIEAGTFMGIRFVGAAGATEARFPQGIGRGIRRTLLHQMLISRAESLEVQFAWGSRVKADAEGVSLNGCPVEYRWLIGADGNNSQVRRFAGLDVGRATQKRIGLRRHFRIRTWSEFVEIYWGESCQAYVTPIAGEEVCVALISRNKPESFECALAEFPRLKHELQKAEVCSTARGALTLTRQFPAVTTRNIALVGEASGSADAITGEGLAVCFRQAVALGRALAAQKLQSYEMEHRKIMSLPHFMGRAMLLMDKSPVVRARTLRALINRPEVFQQMLSIHVGATPVTRFGLNNALQFGWQFLNA